MDTSPEEAEEALLGVCFTHPSWLGGPLGMHNVIDYFAASEFYDKSCNNELLRMQERDISFLKNMTGLEYEVRYADEPQGIFVICKQMRESPKLAHPQSYYYIMHGTVYQCPTIQHVLTARLMICSYHLEEAFSTVRSAVRFDPSQEPNYIYDFTALSKAAEDDQSAPTDDVIGKDEDISIGQDKTQDEMYRLQQTAERSSRILNSIADLFPLPGEAPRPPHTNVPSTGASRHGQHKRVVPSVQDSKKRRLADM